MATVATETATFAAGCFWSVELAFQRVPGVIKTTVGYTQGHVDNPTYSAVCSGSSGHAEAVQVEFDPSAVTYEQLLDLFWSRHDPTQVNRQGNDRGSQYRSGIYFHSPAQQEAAMASKGRQQKRYSKPIATEVLSADGKPFYPAEEYHQQYLSKGGRCGRAQSGAKGCTDPIRCYG
eukprot:TRINITY_DN2673_c0_g1_i4.p1 TRINITY_DN2673_c0_g1~~TRINITY_DN2673_c0_g1_i4.p1  ORF type:complete len:176 (-),score=3.14 TRINITY_DN2673_c0_g1_i4:138-665(-)